MAQVDLRIGIAMKIPTPKETADNLMANWDLTEDQSNSIAAEVYQPLKEKIETIQKAVLLLTSCMAVDLGSAATKSIIKDLDL